uniref:Secreted protein n=1 Tax=Romanomermis culicivorax TaxID=13658 RepID=A0A915J6J9_ROMCU
MRRLRVRLSVFSVSLSSAMALSRLFTSLTVTLTLEAIDGLKSENESSTNFCLAAGGRSKEFWK